MTKAKSFKITTALLMAVIMMFATLGVTAFAASVEIYSMGPATDMSAKIVFTDCDHNGTRSTPAQISISTPRTCKLTFTTSTPSATIKFYKGDSDTPSATFTTPTYVSGMPTTLETYIDLGAGDYTIAVSSASSLKRTSGYFIVGSVSGISGEN